MKADLLRELAEHYGPDLASLTPNLDAYIDAFLEVSGPEPMDPVGDDEDIVGAVVVFIEGCLTAERIIFSMTEQRVLH